MNKPRKEQDASGLRRFKAYPAYKDSGVEWLGKIPTHWSISRIAEYTRLINGYPFDSEFFVRRDGIPLVRIRDLNGTETEVNYIGPVIESAWIEPGDVIIGMDGDFNIERWRGPRALLNQRMCCLRPRGSTDSGFVAYLLPVPLKVINELTYSTTVKHLSSTDVRKIRFGAPPPNEQRAITAFLDRQTARIDALVEKNERLIKLLQEKRTALITGVVTKGLEPSVPMKDSGVESLGEIPEHWKLTRLRYACSLLRDGTHQPPPRVAGGYPLLSVRNIVDGNFVRLPDDSFVSEQDFRALQRSFVVQEDDVLLAIVGATLGKVAIVGPQEPFAIQRSLAVLRPRPALLCPRFLALFLESQPFQNLLWQMTGYSAQPGIYLSALASFHAPVPPIGEQFKIIESVRNRTKQIDDMIGRVRDAIGRLKELRAAFISAAVTGKIDVREEVA